MKKDNKITSLEIQFFNAELRQGNKIYIKMFNELNI